MFNFLDILKAKKRGKHIKSAWLKEFVICTHNSGSPKFSEEFTTPVFLFLLYSELALPWSIPCLIDLTSHAPTYSPNTLSFNKISNHFVLCFLFLGFFFTFLEFTFLNNKLFMQYATVPPSHPQIFVQEGLEAVPLSFSFCCLQNWGLRKPMLPDVLIIN